MTSRLIIVSLCYWIDDQKKKTMDFLSHFSSPFTSILMRWRRHSLLSFNLYHLLHRRKDENSCWDLLSLGEITRSDSTHGAAFQVLLRTFRSISSSQLLFQFLICSQLSPDKPGPASFLSSEASSSQRARKLLTSSHILRTQGKNMSRLSETQVRFLFFLAFRLSASNEDLSINILLLPNSTGYYSPLLLYRISYLAQKCSHWYTRLLCGPCICFSKLSENSIV